MSDVVKSDILIPSLHCPVQAGSECSAAEDLGDLQPGKKRICL